MQTSGPESSQGLPTGVALETFAPKFRIGIAQSTDQVGSAPTVVKSRLDQFARQCLDGKTIETRREALGTITPVNQRLLLTYRSAISNEDGIERLIISQQASGAVLTTNAGRLPNVQFSMQILSDGAGGTTLNTTRNKTYADLYKSALTWANGSSTSCPGIFAS